MYFVFFLSLLPISNAKGKTKIANSQSNVPHEILHSATMRNSLERFVPYYFIVFLFVTDERLTRCNSDELNISSIRPKIIREREKAFSSHCVPLALCIEIPTKHSIHLHIQTLVCL